MYLNDTKIHNNISKQFEVKLRLNFNNGFLRKGAQSIISLVYVIDLKCVSAFDKSVRCVRFLKLYWLT